MTETTLGKISTMLTREILDDRATVPAELNWPLVEEGMLRELADSFVEALSDAGSKIVL